MNLTCSDDGVDLHLLDLIFGHRRPVQLLHADCRRPSLSQTVLLDVVSQLLQNRGVTVTEDVSLWAAGAANGDTSQPHTAAELQN